MNAHLKKAKKCMADYVIVYGEKESENNVVTIKDMKNNSHSTILCTELKTYFKDLTTP